MAASVHAVHEQFRQRQTMRSGGYRATPDGCMPSLAREPESLLALANAMTLVVEALHSRPVIAAGASLVDRSSESPSVVGDGRLRQPQLTRYVLSREPTGQQPSTASRVALTERPGNPASEATTDTVEIPVSPAAIRAKW